MAMPTDAEMQEWIDGSVPGSTIAGWAGILDEAYALYVEALGLAVEEPFPTFAYLEDDEHSEAVNEVEVDGAPLRAGPKARFRRFRAAVKHTAGLGPKSEANSTTPIVIQQFEGKRGESKHAAHNPWVRPQDRHFVSCYAGRPSRELQEEDGARTGDRARAH